MNSQIVSVTSTGPYTAEIMRHPHAVPGETWSMRYSFRITSGQRHVFGGDGFATAIEANAVMKACLADLGRGEAA